MFTLVSVSVDQLEWAVETNADIIFMVYPASTQKMVSIDVCYYCRITVWGLSEESTYRWTMTGQWPSSDWLRLKCNFWSASLILFSKKTVICIFCQKPYYIKPFPNLKNNWSKPELTLTPKKFIWRVYEVYILIVYVENDF